MTPDASAAGAAAVSLELAEPLPLEAPVGSEITLRVRVRGVTCDLHGARIEIVSGEDIIVATAELTARHDDFNETAAFAVRAPATVTAFVWRIRFPAQEIGGIACRECVLTVTSRTRPHRASLAVWAVPSSVQIGGRFTIAVGVKSLGACALGGARIEIRDDGGAVAGEGKLDETPLPGTDALYWTEIALPGPRKEGPRHWSVEFAAIDVALPHVPSSLQFGFIAVRPPEHRVAVTVTESDGAAPVEGAQVALGPYRAATGKAGTAHIDVPAGTYNLAIWKSGFEAASRTVEIAADATMYFEVTRLPEELTAWD
jgi:hypothetical protein